MIHHGDLFDVLPTLAESSIEACVTDPPYELAFMGKKWDASGIAFNVETWQLVSRVLKPGAYLLAFGGSRTFHRMTCAIEDAGFEIRDCLSWLYGSGFPKSLNVGDGRGTALKPAWEPIIMARKPFSGTVAANVLKHGTGALNIDACRIEYEEGGTSSSNPVVRLERGCKVSVGREMFGGLIGLEKEQIPHDLGRWPANVVLDDLAALALDEMTGETQSPSSYARGSVVENRIYGASNDRPAMNGYGDAGGASRFFYCAKPSREERDFGCHDLRVRSGGEATDRTDGSAGVNSPRAGAGRTGGSRNFHPTVKPVELMRWLVRLVTPPNGIVLDPFLGSGTTGMACRYEHREFIGIEREADYIAIAERRIAAVAPLFAGEASA